MKKEAKKLRHTNKRLLPLLAAITLVAGPILLVTACDHNINRYPASLPNDLQNRILFDFNGVNYNVNAKSQFSATFKQGMDFIKKDVEGIMAHQEFYNFFTEKLNYSKDNANALFEKIKDNLGLELLSNDYFSALNSGQNFDSKVYANNLIFQTDNWHQFGTTKFNYANSKFYGQKDHDPNTIFTTAYLYSDLDSPQKDKNIQEVAKYADDHYGDEIGPLTKDHLTWDSPTTTPFSPPTLENDTQHGIADYQKKLQRFKWLLRFRYQQYYYSQILPKLNETLFTMANIFNTILRITKVNGQPKVQIDNSKYAIQLQDWGTNSAWSSKYRWVWDYTVNKKQAGTINLNWDKDPLPDLMTTDAQGNPVLNPEFYDKLASADPTIKNTVDPILGAAGYVRDTSSKDYDKAVKAEDHYISSWVMNGDSTHYWGKNQKGSFAYSAPVYWIDVIENLNFNFFNNPNQPIIVNTSEDYKSLISSWNNSDNSTTSNSNFSKYMRGENMPALGTPGYNAYQEMKWNTVWQMLYFISAQDDSNPNKDVAADNFTNAAKVLYPKYIKKDHIYNSDFWDAVKSYY